MAQRVVGLIITVLALGACTQAVPPHVAATQKAHRISNDAFEKSYAKLHDMEHSVRLQAVDCQCDENLHFAAHLYGVWQIVRIRTNEQMLQDLFYLTRDGREIEVRATVLSKTYRSSKDQEVTQIDIKALHIP